MARIEHDRQAIRQVLTTHAHLEPSDSNAAIECQLIFDAEHDHYQLLDIGWDDLKRVYNCFIHIDIKQGKVWIQRDMTEADLAQELVALGVPREDIVLGMQPLYKRPLTGYGVA